MTKEGKVFSRYKNLTGKTPGLKNVYYCLESNRKTKDMEVIKLILKLSFL